MNGLDHVYRVILEAVGKFPEIQTVLSVGKNINPDVLGPLPPNVIVVSEAPQIELLKRATLCITHAGLNTTLESLAKALWWRFPSGMINPALQPGSPTMGR